MSRILTTTTLFVLASAAVLANDWPSWRGPGGTGVTSETGLPHQWAEASGARLADQVARRRRVHAGRRRPARLRHQPDWQRRPSRRQSSVARAGRDARRRRREESRRPARCLGTVTFALTAYRWSDGGRAWQHETRCRRPASACTTSTTSRRQPRDRWPDRDWLVWDGPGRRARGGERQTAVVAASRQRLWRLSRSTGAMRAPRRCTATSRSSPAITSPARILLALDKRTGAVRWKRDRQPGAHSYSTPLVVSHDGRRRSCSTRAAASKASTRRPAAAMARARRQSLSHPDAGAPRGHPVSEPRVSQQPVPRDSAWRHRRCRQQPCRVEDADRRAVRLVARALRWVALHGHRDGHRHARSIRQPDNRSGASGSAASSPHPPSGATARSISPANRAKPSSCAPAASRTPLAQSAQRSPRRVASDRARQDLPARGRRADRGGSVTHRARINVLVAAGL